MLKLLVLRGVLGHMELLTPAPRRSKYNTNYAEGDIDYSMSSPLNDDGRDFPCLGYPRGPPSAAYRAGKSISVSIIGTAPHNGGHCQFSISYDGIKFVVLKTIMGKCPAPRRKFSVKIPPSAGTGAAVFAWTWINRSGQREFYMNCADINILGKKKGHITGHELLVANYKVPGKASRIFPEGFANSYGKSIINSTPKLTITPKTSTQPYPPKRTPKRQIPTPPSTYNASTPTSSPIHSTIPLTRSSSINLLPPHLILHLITTLLLT
ncbi:hypothetical protein DSO57_1028485 [Entomophthora muscae]|uniref:Uncharacterized protein n=1 Tax=Entomophthora muscae TaxID=34485 RepID=A0ACC2UM28_9FUNG|nr:hypothetical protein DSO57_1028485 [Entomophthora muscae]